MNTQCRVHRTNDTWNPSPQWTDYGNVGWIEAAKFHAEQCSLSTGAFVEVRDGNDPTRNAAIFEMKRVTTYEDVNQMQGSE